MNIGFDFDKTIFDTDKFSESIPTDLKKFKDSFEEAYLGNYSTKKHAEILRTDGEDITAQEIEEIYSNSNQYLRHIDILENLQKNNDLFLITRADHKGWQQKKIEASNVREYFKDIIIVYKGQKKDFPELDVLIDDNKDELQNFHGRKIHYPPEKGLKETLESLKYN